MEQLSNQIKDILNNPTSHNNPAVFPHVETMDGRLATQTGISGDNWKMVYIDPDYSSIKTLDKDRPLYSALDYPVIYDKSKLSIISYFFMIHFYINVV